MRNALAIAKKELAIYFTTPWAYVVITGMVMITAFFFNGGLNQFIQAQQEARVMGWAQVPAEFKNLTDGVIVPLWGVTTIFTVFAAPLLTMGLFAREKRERTFELLMTTPLRPWEIVAGKYLSGVVVTTVTLGSTFVFPLILAAFGSSESGQALEWQTVWLGFGGLLLLGALCAAVTMLISAFTQTELLAGFMGIILMMAWLFVSALAQSVENQTLRAIASQVSLVTHLQPLMRGVIELKGLALFFSGIALCLLVTERKVEWERWA